MKTFNNYIVLREAREGSIPSPIKKKAQDFLHKIGTEYHKSIPIKEILDYLKVLGITLAEPDFLFTGRDGRDTFELMYGGSLASSNLIIAWHKMDVTGNWEITAYLS